MNKNTIKYIFIISILWSTFTTTSLYGQCKQTTEGRAFWVGFLENYAAGGLKTLELSITAKAATTCRVYHQGGNALFATVTVPAGGAQRVVLTPYTGYDFSDGTVLSQDFYIEADDPVSVYAIHTNGSSSDATVLYPLTALGKEYYAMTHKASGEVALSQVGLNNVAQIRIVATQDNTQVNITPVVETKQNQPAGTSFQVTLQQGESYLVMAKFFLFGEDGDLTGSKIQANHPIAVFSGNLRAKTDISHFGSNHHYEQLPSVEKWGKSFITLPSSVDTGTPILRQFDFYKILAQREGTLVQISGDPNSPILLGEGEFYEFNTSGNNTPRVIEASAPILLGHISTSDFSSSGGFSNQRGDSYFVLLSPNEQAIENITFEAISTTRVTQYHLDVLTKTSNTGNITLDGASSLNFTPIAGTAYSKAHTLLSAGTHTLDNGGAANEGFIAYTYGHGRSESYGYSVGTGLQNILDLGEDALYCEGLITEQVLESRGSNFATYQWRRLPSSTILATTEAYTATQTGSYELTATDSQGCIEKDTIELIFSPPPIAQITHNNLTLDTLRVCDSLGTQILNGSDPSHTALTSYAWYELGSSSPLGTQSTLAVNNFSTITTYVLEVKNPSPACNALTLGDSYDTLSVIFEPTHDAELLWEGSSTPDTLFFCDQQGEQMLSLSSLPTDVQIQWFEEGVLQANTTSTLVLNNFSAATRYRVEVRRPNQSIDCPQTDEVVVLFTPTPVTNISLGNQNVSEQQLIFCDNEGVQQISGLDPSHQSGVQYEWYQTNNSAEPLTTPFATTASVLTNHFSSTKIYTLLVKDRSNPATCTDTTWVSIEFKPSPEAVIHYEGIQAAPVLRFCDNENKQLLYIDSVSHPTGTSYQWFEQTSNTLLSSFASLEVNNFSDTTTYRVEATLNGCVSRDTVMVVFFPAALVLQEGQIASDTLIFCDNEGAQSLRAGYSSTSAGLSYSWKDITDPTQVQEVGTAQDLTVSNFSDTTIYEITLTDAINGIINPCQLKDTVTVLFFGNTAVQIRQQGENNYPDSLILCAEEVGVFLETGLPNHLLSSTTFLWEEIGNTTTLIGQNTSVFVDEFVAHQKVIKNYRVTIQNSIFGCQVSDTLTITFLPPLEANLSGSAVICQGQTAPVTFTLSGAFPLKLSYRETLTNGSSQVQEVYVGTETTSSPFDYIIPSTGGTYEILALSDTLCSLLNTPSTLVEVTVTPKPEVLISAPDTVLCVGETTTFKAEGATNYVFYKNGLPMPAGAVSDEYTPLEGTLQNGDQVWVIGETNGCPDTSRVMSVIVNPLPVVDLGVDRYKCSSDTALLIAPEGDFIYDWRKLDPDGNPILVGNGNDTLFALDTGTYFIRLENILTGCSSFSNRIQVFNFDEPIVDLGENRIVCDPSDLPHRLVASDLSHLNGTTYEWYVTGDNTILGTDSVYDVRSENTYSVIVQDPRGCRIKDTVRVELAPDPDFVIRGHEEPTCSTFDTLRIERTNVRGMIIEWFGGNVVSLSDSNKVAIVNQSGIYTATVTDTTTLANCFYTQSVEVFVRPSLNLEVPSDTIRLCEEDSLVLDVFDATHEDNFIYEWRVIESDQVVSTDSRIAIHYAMVENYSANRFEVSITDPNLTGGGSCSITDTLIVRFDRKSGVQIDSNFVQTLCLGSTQFLSASGADAYEWSDGSTTPSIEFTPTEVGFYTFIVHGIFSENQCGATSDTVKFRVVPVPEIDLPESLVLCESDSIALDAFLPSHEPRYIYEWSNDDTGELLDTTRLYVFKQDSSNLTYETQTYRVGVYDTLGGGRCGSERLIRVTFNRSSDVEVVASDTLVCVGDAITLSAQGASNFRWNTGDTTQSITVQSDSAGIFRYTVVGSYGEVDLESVCDSTVASILVQFKGVPSVRLNQPDTISICAGDSIQMIASGGATYSWSHSPTAVGDTVVVYPTDTTTYVVTGFDTLGCSSTDTVVVLAQPQVDLGGDIQLCEGDTAIIGTPRPFGASFLWNTGQTSDTIRVRRSGTYYLEVRINECSYTDSIKVNFIEPPVLRAKDTILCFEDENQGRILHELGAEVLNYDSSARYRYQWFDESDNLVSQDSVLSAEFGGTYLLRVTADYEASCSAMTSLEIESACEPELYIPEAFTPNEDQLNEEWETFGRNYSLLRIKVLDRWGMEVYSTFQQRSDAPITFWDGSYKGKKVPAGVYYYEITYTSKIDSSKIIKRTGTVTVIY